MEDFERDFNKSNKKGFFDKIKEKLTAAKKEAEPEEKTEDELKQELKDKYKDSEDSFEENISYDYVPDHFKNIEIENPMESGEYEIKETNN